jgi:hypothetical protein
MAARRRVPADSPRAKAARARTQGARGQRPQDLDAEFNARRTRDSERRNSPSGIALAFFDAAVSKATSRGVGVDSGTKKKKKKKKKSALKGTGTFGERRAREQEAIEAAAPDTSKTRKKVFK